MSPINALSLIAGLVIGIAIGWMIGAVHAAAAFIRDVSLREWLEDVHDRWMSEELEASGPEPADGERMRPRRSL